MSWVAAELFDETPARGPCEVGARGYRIAGVEVDEAWVRSIAPCPPADEATPPPASPLAVEVVEADALAAWAVVDGARAPGAAELEGAVCLYPGALDARRAALAPYLVPFGPAVVAAVDGRGDPAWIGLRSAAGLEVLVRHLRKLLEVRGPDGAALGFRLYDPRVATPFLPTLDAHGVARVFGSPRCASAAGTLPVCPACGASPRAAEATACARCGQPLDRPLIEALVSADPDPTRTRIHRPGEVAREARRGPTLRVGAAQLAALEADAARRDLRRRLAVRLEQVFASQCAFVGPDEVRAAVVYGERWARRCGLVEEAHTARLLDVLFLTDRRLFAQPWAGPWREPLEDPALTPAQRVERAWAQTRAFQARNRAPARTRPARS